MSFNSVKSTIYNCCQRVLKSLLNTFFGEFYTLPVKTLVTFWKMEDLSVFFFFAKKCGVKSVQEKLQKRIQEFGGFELKSKKINKSQSVVILFKLDFLIQKHIASLLFKLSILPWNLTSVKINNIICTSERAVFIIILTLALVDVVVLYIYIFIEDISHLNAVYLKKHWRKTSILKENNQIHWEITHWYTNLPQKTN